MDDIIFNRSKIVATVGPASNTYETLTKLVQAGVDVFRLNFSHGTHMVHKEVIQHIRAINKELGTHVAILQDLQGPKIRTREIQDGEVFIEEGQKLLITTEDIVGTAEKISTTYQPLPEDIKKGDTILIDDGNIELRVEGVKDNEVETTVIYGGSLKSRKGINLPDTNVSAPSLTEKDHKDLLFGLENEVDWVALSFVRKAEDILELKKIIAEHNVHTKVVAKIEKPEAIRNIDEIINATDAVMVARGDLGVEMPMQEVPVLQKMMVRKCNKAAKPVIIATQMMESMIQNPRPTRAEANDVANAVLDGADAVMLSAETAAGKYPVKTIHAMTKIISSIEGHESIFNKFDTVSESSASFYNDKIVVTACRLCEETGAKAIVGLTKSGYTAFRIASHRPRASIFIFTSDEKLLNTLNLTWGVRSFYYDEQKSTDSTFDKLEQILKDKKLLKSGEIFVNTASMPLHWQNKTNMIKIKVAD